MCDYCSCRNHPIVARLGDEHDAILDLVDGAERAVVRGDLEAAHAVAERLVVALAPHLALEERALFPALDTDAFFGETVAALRADHEGVRSIDLGGPPTGAWGERLTAFLADLRAHIGREETDVFPAAAQFLAPERWAEAEAAALP